MKYRPDIDGLRAVAVMAVVLHHLSSRLVPGGYIGVDVFFVISGYLITKIITKEIAEGTFTFARFYERRARRILPALCAVLAAVLGGGYFILLPTDYLVAFRGTLATLLFSANILFWRDLAEGYFAADSKLNPLLHMWSLGVEEQFYLLFPILLLLAARCLRDRLITVLLLIMGLSLVFAQLLLAEKAVAVFFLLPFRAWELLVGAILAIAAVPRLRTRWGREALAMAGLLLIVVPAFVYHPTHMPFPAITAVPPVLGAALLIHVGGNGPSLVGRLLQLRPVVYVGLISYSLYLWHWPLIVFTRFWIGLEPLRPWIPALLAASLVIASASYHFIEQPFRRLRLDSSRLPAIGLGATAVALVAVSWVGIAHRGLEGRVSPTTVAVDRARTAPIPFRECESKILAHSDGMCVIGASSQEPEVLLWGDSHMLAWLPGFEAALRQTGKAALVAPNSACPPILGLDNGADVLCREQNLAVFAALKAQPQLKTVVMAGFWSMYFADSKIPLFSPEGIGGNESVAPPAFRSTVAAAVSLGKHVVVLGPVPTYTKDVPLALAQREMMGRGLAKQLTLQDVHKANESFYQVAESVVSPQYVFIDAAAWLCKPECAIYEDGVSLYRDSNHLSGDGAAQFTSKLVDVLKSVSNVNALIQAPLSNAATRIQ